MKIIATAFALLLCAAAARALPLPAPAELQKQLGAPQTIQVIEPHMSSQGHEVRASYRGYPATQVLTRLLGADWNKPQREIEFRALDGFVSRVPVERFAKYRAFIVFARADGGDFLVDNPAQNEKRVLLGPFYLVWDNLAAPELVAEGGAVWPYQVAEIASRPGSQAALLPDGLPAKNARQYAEAAALAQKFCLSCHQINGYGGDKMPINLAARAKEIDARRWQHWLLAPQELKPGTTMPALPDTLSLAERQSLADKLHRYLTALPVQR